MNPENIGKPPSLYHGSPVRDIEILEPKNKTSRDSKDSPVIFATPDLGLASIFMLNCNARQWNRRNNWIGKKNQLNTLDII